MLHVHTGFHHRCAAISGLLVLFMLSACDSAKQSASPSGSSMAPPEVDDLEAALLADPVKLKSTMQQCRDHRSSMDEAVCTAATRAHRKRFMGDGKSNYTRGNASPANP